MKRNYLIKALFVLLCFTSKKNYAQDLESDSLALVALYNATDGENCWNNTN